VGSNERKNQIVKVTILDGGMGQELLKRTEDTPTSLWATQLMIDHPDIVGAVHDDYFSSGADICTTNTYALHHDRLLSCGENYQFEHLHRLACEIALNSRNKSRKGLLAGSLGPLGWSYNTEFLPPLEEAAKLYAEIVEIHSNYVDMFIIETVSSLDQGRGALTGVKKTDKPIWIAFSVDDFDGSKLRSGEPLSSIKTLVNTFKPAAVLLNCSVPESINVGLPFLQDLDIPFGAYANGFTHISKEYLKKGSTVNALSSRTDLSPDKYADFASGWIEMGATIIGGCCEIGPSHINELAKRFKEHD